MMFKTLFTLSFLGTALAYTPAPGGTASCWTLLPASTGTTPSPSPIPNAQPVWAQCGGVNYAGPTACQPGLYCHEYNEWYSQCLSAPTSTTTIPPTTSPSGIVVCS